MTTSSLSRDDLRVLTVRFLDAFNTGNLDAVMSHFAEDALYMTYDGKAYRGKRAVRDALEPQFLGAYGRLTFHVQDLILDEESQKATVRWLCRHELGNERDMPSAARAQRLVFRGALGRVFGWYGLDVLHFEGGLVSVKRTYTHAPLPLMTRDPSIPDLPPDLGG